MPPFRVLYIDMNSFFASVEQHEHPRLRGRPVGITAVEGDSGACVAASYEAKAFGVKTGTLVREAKQLCPGIALLPSRHRLYARYNLRIADMFDQMAEVERIRSIDEFQIALSGDQQTLEGAAALVRAMKARLAAEVSPHIRFSAGIGPNHLLAKIAGKLEKPNGFQWLSPDNLPDRLDGLKLDDLPGISRGILAKLFKARIWDIPALYRLDPRHARLIWRSVEGERFVRALQGEDIPLLDTQRHGYGNSKILSPENRPPREAYLVSRWLVEKAANRLRRDGRVAGNFMASASFISEGGWGRRVKIAPSQDTSVLLQVHHQIWVEMWQRKRPRGILAVSVHLGDVGELNARQGDFFLPLDPGAPSRGEQVAAVVDQINARFGRDTLSWGQSKPHPGFFERG